MTKITADHLGRSAFVYIRQSTADQLLHNPESRRRQYGLADRARQLGWTMVEVIDDDLGRSGGGINRPGFERLLAAICEGRVGAVFAIEASRLARNGRDWHTLIEFCGLVGTIIVDEDGIYDPRHPNDRLLLGMKGTMSELELSLFRQRSHEALKQKARRGALFLGVAAGYVRIGHDRIDKGHVRQAGGDSRLKRRRQRCGGLGGKSSAVRDAAGAIDGLADCAASGAPLSSPAPPVHRCAAAGLDSDAPAARWASMPFDGPVDRLKLAMPRMRSAVDRLHLPERPARPWLRPACSGAATATRRFARAVPHRSVERSRLHWGRCRRRQRGA